MMYGKLHTGSTFTTELLNKHSEIYASFEPLGNMGVEEMLNGEVQMIDDALKCKFTK